MTKTMIFLDRGVNTGLTFTALTLLLMLIAGIFQIETMVSFAIILMVVSGNVTLICAVACDYLMVKRRNELMKELDNKQKMLNDMMTKREEQ